jgi:hypothetical protein
MERKSSAQDGLKDRQEKNNSRKSPRVMGEKNYSEPPLEGLKNSHGLASLPHHWHGPPSHFRHRTATGKEV